MAAGPDRTPSLQFTLRVYGPAFTAQKLAAFKAALNAGLSSVAGQSSQAAGLAAWPGATQQRVSVRVVDAATAQSSGVYAGSPRALAAPRAFTQLYVQVG